MFRLRIHTGEFEYVAEPRSGPFGVADAAASPLHAGNLGVVERAPVAGALERAGDSVLRQLLQLGDGDLEFFRDQSVDAHALRRRVDGWRLRNVLADEERVER